MIVLSDAELVKQVLSTKWKNYPKDKQAYGSFGPILGGGLVTLEGSAWKFHGAMISPLFHFDSLREMAHDIFTRVIMNEVHKLDAVANTGKLVRSK